MILSDSDRFWTSLNAQPLGFREMDQSVLIVPGFVFTQPQHGPRRAKSRLEVNHVLERFDRLRIASTTKEDETEVPPALLPRGTQLQSALVVANCLIHISGISRGNGFLRQIVEVSGRRICACCGVSGFRNRGDSGKKKRSLRKFAGTRRLGRGRWRLRDRGIGGTQVRDIRVVFYRLLQRLQCLCPPVLRQQNSNAASGRNYSVL